MHLTVFGAVLALALSSAACKSGSSSGNNSSGAPADAGSSIDAASSMPPADGPVNTGALPPGRFFQVPTGTAPGAVIVERAFYDDDDARHGALEAVIEADGATKALRIREQDGRVVPLDVRGHFFATISSMTTTFRIACASQVAGVAIGPGPSGSIYGVPASESNRLACFAAGSAPDAPWKVLEIAKGRDVMHVPVALGGETANTIEVAYFRDSRFDPNDFRNRTFPADAVVRTKITYENGAFSLSPVDEQPYPQPSDLLATARRTAKDCRVSECGKTFDKVDTFFDCPPCGNGLNCFHGQCSTQTCAPLTRDEVCKGGPEGLPCGKFSDGCGGVIDCATACPTGTTCGGGDEPRLCGSAGMTIPRLKAKYKDENDLLCGTISGLDLSAYNRAKYSRDCPKEGDVCTKNLCVRP